jgi:hypothetical protein
MAAAVRRLIRLRLRMKTVWRPLPKPGRIICISVSRKGCILSSRGVLSCRGSGGCACVAVFPVAGRGCHRRVKLAQADKHTNAGMLRERYNYYCEKVVKGFYKNHFLRFDRQIVLVDCLQPLNSGPQALTICAWR